MIRIAVTTGAVTRADLEPEADLVLDEMRDLLAVALAAESVR